MATPKISRIGTPPWFYTAVFVCALVVQCVPAWREALIYDRSALARGELWRVWTAQIVHFGWPHFIADGGLLLIIGWTLGREFPRDSWIGLLAMPPVICAVLYWCDPTMVRYAGLSAVNLGLLLLLAARGWRGDMWDWFWPAIVGIYVVELGYEIWKGGRGGGFIEFDDANVKVATSAHLSAVGYALIAWLLPRMWRRGNSSTLPPT